MFEPFPDLYNFTFLREYHEAFVASLTHVKKLYHHVNHCTHHTHGILF